MLVLCHRGDTLSMLVMNELVEHGVAVKIVDIFQPSGEGIAVYSAFSKENWTVGVTHTVYVSSEDDIPRVVREIRRILWHEMSLEERAEERKDRRKQEKKERQNKDRFSATAVASG